MPADDNPDQTRERLNRDGKLVIPEINGLRGIAILGVIFTHATFYSITTVLKPSVFGFSLTPFLVPGWHGVNLFFVLSAFVLFLPYVSGQRDLRAPGGLWRFYKQRALRLLPAYYLIVIAEMAFAGHSPLADGTLVRETLAVLTFTFSFMPDIWLPAAVNGSIWSLGTEVLFSAVFPLLCWLCLRFGSARVLIVALFVGFGFRFLGFVTAPPPISWLEAMLVGRIDEFLWGFFLAEMFARGRIPQRPYLLCLAGAVILLPVIDLYGHLRVFIRYMVGYRNDFLFHLFLTGLVTLLDVAIALFVAAALAGRSRWSDVLNMRWLRVAGMACYSLYLWHYPLLFSFNIPADPFNPPNVAAFLLFLGVMSAITYRFVEFRTVADWRSLFLLDRPNRWGRRALPLVRGDVNTAGG